MLTGGQVKIPTTKISSWSGPTSMAYWMNDSKSEPGGIVAYIGILLDGVATVGQKWKKKVQEVVAKLPTSKVKNQHFWKKIS